MTHKEILPAAALQNHTAVLGKTGAGKTSTVKLIIEQVAAEGARVCILDPIKSDHWGLTSSADGRRPGLPFYILGGPRGHVPLHSSAGKAIGEVVGSGALPLSILDMADFEAGGSQRFFVEFAQALLRNMRGVLYLVVEEAHEFAPKETAGFKGENMAIHYAKKLATAGRSKGIRLIVATQRTQALHNAVLGSCETMIAHRLTAPADQKPVLDWLKANVPDKKQTDGIAASLSSLPTGTAWVCSGEAGIFVRRAFPRISTYDNSATPSGDSGYAEVKTAAVDQEALRDIIGAAVEEAQKNDPAALKRRVADLERHLAAKPAAPAAVKETVKRVEVPVLKDSQITRLEALFKKMQAEAERHGGAMAMFWQNQDEINNALLKALQQVAGGQQALAPRPATASVAPAKAVLNGSPADEGVGATRMGRAMLTVLAQRGALTKKQILIFTGYRSSGPVSATFAALARDGLVAGDRSTIQITDAGREALGSYIQLPTGAALRQHILGESTQMERKMLEVLFDAYPNGISKGEILQRTGYASSGPVSAAFAKLCAVNYAVRSGREMRAADELFLDGA